MRMNPVHTVIIGRNENIKSGIMDFMVNNGWETAYISGAVGSVIDVSLTTPISAEFPPKVQTTQLEGPGEILAFTGEVMPLDSVDPTLPFVPDDGPLFIHIHASIACAGAKVSGGGLRDGKAWRSLKVYIQKIS